MNISFNNKKSLVLIIVILLLLLGVVGTTYAYFMINAQDDDTIVGLSATADLTLNVSKVTPTSNNGDMVPQLEDALSAAVSTNYNCIDGNNNVVCHIYKIDVKNTGTANIKVKGTIIFENPADLNLKYKLMDNPTTLSSTSVSHYGYEDMETPIVNNVSLKANQTNTYYIVVWIDETETSQNDNGTYRATIKFENMGIPGATSTYVNYLVNSSTDNFRSDTYREKIKNISFVNYIDTTNAVESWDMGTLQDGGIIAWLEETQADSYDLYIGSNDVIYGRDMRNFFMDMTHVENINFNNLNTSQATNMTYMFRNFGSNSSELILDLGSNFDTSNVTNMNRMFQYTGQNSTNFTLDLGENFDTSNVIDMYYMFNSTGRYSEIFTLDLGDKFDTSNVTNMSCMFVYAGASSTTFTLELGNKFNTANVTNMSSMFNNTGASSTIFTLDLGDKFDTSNVTNMSTMFTAVGISNNIFTLDLGDKFDTSNVTNMSNMFSSVGKNSEIFTLDLGDKFYTNNVTDMQNMFNNTGYANNNFELDISNIVFDNVNIYDSMFKGFKTTQKIYVKDTNAQSWILDKGFANLSENNVIIKNS